MENEKMLHKPALKGNSLFPRNKRGERRVSPSLYKVLIASHIIVSVGWLGTAFAKLVLELTAITIPPDASMALYLAMEKLHIAFPILAIGTIITGVVLSLGTKWGLLEHYWIVIKLVLTVGVIVTALRLDERFIRLSISALSRHATDNGTILGIAWPTILLISMTVAHLLMLGAATVISVYKPWGKTRFGLRKELRLKD